MRKFLSLLLAVMMLISVFAVMPSTANAAETFKEGDVLYLKVISPAAWAENDPIMYANFTEYSRADNGNKSVIIADADTSKYDPVTGVEYLSDREVYKYTVTKNDAGATAMRFWRGNQEKLWNCSIVLTAADFANGYNMVTVDGSAWDDEGDLLTMYDIDVAPSLALSSKTGDIGDTFDVRVNYYAAPNAQFSFEIKANGETVSNTNTYSFTATHNGAVAIEATVIATDASGKILGKGTVTDTIMVGTPAVTAATSTGLFAHAYSGDSKESEAWVKWYDKDGIRYFFMPAGINDKSIEIYNAYATDAVINGVTIAPGTIGFVNFKEGTQYTVSANNKTYTAQFMISSAEAAVFVNNPSDFDGKDLWDYLTADKENSTSATAATLDNEGNLSSEGIKKIKGRGNTSWDAEKKGFNITYNNAISLDGMQNCKKFSIISNFQDAALSRNRILYDLADEIGVPYASDSRFTEIYINGEYIGNYMMCEKVDIGKNTLIPDVAEEDYLDYVAKTATAFSFICEVDNNPSYDDFTVETSYSRLTIKSPELESSDENYNKVSTFIRAKYDVMFDKLMSNATDVNDYIDIESLAQVYLINELGKNWDAGAGSFFFVYKPDENGKFKFYASPVWDYDNSLGNANGVENDLRNLGISDYTLPTGWFAKLKNAYYGKNMLRESVAKCDALNDMIPTVWFEQFVPAIEKKLNGKGLNNTELYSADVYYDYLAKSADMNYKRWAMVTDTHWIANHTSLKKSSATYTYNEYGQVTAVSYKQDSTATNYEKYNFKAEFDYMIDWTNSRAAWLSSQYFDSYTPSEVIPTQPPTQEPTDPVITPDPEPVFDKLGAIAMWQFDPTDKVEGEKLIEYGTGDDGYKATYGNGTLSGTIDGTNMRALEWSAAEYGTNGVNMVPIMPAGSKNLWGTPYVEFELSTKDYTDIKLTMYLAGSKKCPASWKLQYSLDGQDFTDIENAVATIELDKRKLMTAYFDKLSLPSAIDNQDTVYLRMVPVSDTTVNGGSTADDPSGGELAINNILISGTKSSTGVRGDVDLSGEVSIIDATYIQRHLAKLTTLSEASLALADVDDTPGVSIIDATTIQRYLAKITDKL